MAKRIDWTREQRLVAYYLYFKIPFGRFHSANPDVIHFAGKIGRTPSALAQKLSNIASLDPSFIESGRKGFNKVANEDKTLWQEMSQDWNSFAVEMDRALAFYGATNYMVAHVNAALPVPPKPVVAVVEPDWSADDRVMQAKVRIGQSMFRMGVLNAYDARCCISGLSIPQLLVASHIVPWSVEKSFRRNPANGLCLSTLHDKAFDRGMLCLNDDYTVRIADRFRHLDDPFWQSAVVAFEGHCIRMPNKFWPDRDCLAYHREFVFLG